MKIAPATAKAVIEAVALFPVHRIPEDFFDALPAASLSRVFLEHCIKGSGRVLQTNIATVSTSHVLASSL